MKKRSVLTGWLCSYVFILMIPIVTIFVNYTWNKEIIQDEIFEANNLVLTNLGDEIDKYLNQEISLYSYLLQNKTFINVISSREKNAQFYYDVTELMYTIRNYDSDISGLVYLKELDHVIDGQGTNDSKHRYQGMRMLFPDMMSYDDWLKILSDEYQGNFFFQDKFYYNTSEVCLIYANSVREYSQYESFNLFVSIPVSILEKLTRSLSDGSRLLIRIGEGDVLALSSTGVDEIPDEFNVNWGNDEPAESERYMEIYRKSKIPGIEYCLLIPKNEFWNQLSHVRNMLYISVAVTFLIGFFCVSVVLNRNFKPVARLVQKIMGEEKAWGNEYKLIEDAYVRLVSEKNSMHRHIATQEESLQSSYLLAMMKGRSIEAAENVVPLKSGQKMVLTGFLVPLMDEKQFLQDEVMLFAVDNIFSELMNGQDFYRIEDGQYLFYLFLIPNETEEWKKHFLKSAEYLSSFIQERLGVFVYSALSGVIDEPGNLRFIYQDVMDGLKNIELFKKSSVTDMGAREEAGSKGIVQIVIEYVEAHFEDSNLNISTIAEGIERNPKYISRIFREETNESILDYLNRLRIKKARILMQSGEFTLEQISQMVGYASSKTFRRTFLKETGMTPSSYQETMKK